MTVWKKGIRVGYDEKLDTKRYRLRYEWLNIH